MRKLLTYAVTACIAVLAACADGSSTSPESSPELDARGNVALPTCENLKSTAVNTLIDATYKYVGLDPLLGRERWKAIASTRDQAQAWAMAREILEAKQQKGLASTTDMTRLINYIFCYVGLKVGFPGGDAWVVEPSDVQINLVTTDKQAAFVLPAGSIEQISLLAITSTTDTLRTNLDKYPIVRQFSKYPLNTFEVPAGVYICASVPFTNQNYQAILDRMRLGHNLGTSGFEILPAAKDGIPLLACDENILAGAPPTLFERAIDLVLPKYLWAQKYETRGCAGVGGNVSELSPIGPVDPQIISAATSSTSQSAPAGSFVSSPPAIALFTANGTPLGSIPVTFSVTAGGGTITPTTPVLSDAKGTASSTSWRLGTTVGATNTARATPATGGAAVPGTFFSPTVIDFTATGTTASATPTGIRLTGGPALGLSYTAGTTLPSLSAAIIDANGNTVTSYTGTVTVAGTLANSLQGTLSATAVNGVANFSNLRAVLVGSQAIRATTVSGTTTLTSTGPNFTITAAAPSSMTLVSGNGTTAAVGTTPTTPPSVLVRDVYGNAVPNATVYFRPSNNSSSVSVSGLTSGTGNASPSTWSLQFGTNNLMASLDSPINSTNTTRRVEFSSSGTSTTESPLISCTALSTTDKPLITGYAVSWTTNSTQQLRTITNVKLWLSKTVLTSPTTTQHSVRVQATPYINSTAQAAVVSTYSTAVLLGASSENKEVNFNFPNGIPLSRITRVVFRVQDVVSSSQVRFNAGTNVACNSTSTLTTKLAAYRTGSAIQVISR